MVSVHCEQISESIKLILHLLPSAVYSLMQTGGVGHVESVHKNLCMKVRLELI